ncbi:MAG: hypothetical protein CVU67_00380 [Deltaproteobacteria bacterium HGW-Deltaproteobacteria-24]|nr:MAG: hypothetical protein CVU67_00380 [Deltaproteobacteria bacterium HGW-Deltaproteobacteria-24]
MRRRFSEKYGYTELRTTFQIDNIDNRLRRRIWNRIREDILDKISKDDYSSYFKYLTEHKMFVLLYDEHIGVDIKPTKHVNNLSNQIKEYYEKIQWHQIYDLLEALVYYHYNENKREIFKQNINKTLEQEMSGYRFVDDCIAPIVDDVEIKEIEDVFKSEYDSVKRHLAKALEHLSDRENPDFQNSIKESITAVESIAQIITESKKDLGACIKQMNLDIQKQFTKTLSGLYTWTCQEDGMRHAHTGEELKTGFDEAKFMLVACSAFINYLISKQKNSITES